MKGLSDTSTGSNNDVFGDGEFAIWQDALIFTSILMVFIIAGIMGYFFAKLREGCGDGNKSGAEELGFIPIPVGFFHQENNISMSSAAFSNTSHV